MMFGLKARILSENRNFWPEDISADIKETPSDALVEERTVINLIAETKMCLRVSLGKIIDLQRYSSYEKLLRVTSYVIRFASKLYKHTVLWS